MKRHVTYFLACALAAAGLYGCGATPNTGNAEERQLLHTRTTDTLSMFKQRDPSLQPKMDAAYAWAIFPEVKAAAVGVGGAYGAGEVYQGGRLIGYADMTQGNVGVQLGAQKYAELILFQNQQSLSDFQQSTLEFDARATAVAADNGAASTADYTKGVIVFSLPQGGLMFQAAVGGQKFRYTPLDLGPAPGQTSAPR